MYWCEIHGSSYASINWRKTNGCTGGNAGLGLETVKALAAAGCEVMFTSRNKAAGDSVVQSISEVQSCSATAPVNRCQLSSAAWSCSRSRGAIP